MKRVGHDCVFQTRVDPSQTVRLVGVTEKSFGALSRPTVHVVRRNIECAPKKPGRQCLDQCDDLASYAEPSTSSVLSVRTYYRNKDLEVIFVHWKCNLDVLHATNEIIVTFPGYLTRGAADGDAVITARVEAGRLVCVIDATTERQLEQLKRLLVRQMSRFLRHDASAAVKWVDL